LCAGFCFWTITFSKMHIVVMLNILFVAYLIAEEPVIAVF